MKLTVTENEMQSFADGLLMRLSGGSVILLSGELGAGKTTLVKALGIGLGIEKTITSPTFTLMNIYKILNHKSINTLCHIDTYRIENIKDFREIGVEEYVGQPEVLTIIEWPEKMQEYFEVIPGKIITINITGSGESRTIEII